MLDSCEASMKVEGCPPPPPPPIPRERLKALRHPRLLPRSIPSSFALQSQLLGVEFCASISAAMVDLAKHTTTTNTTTSSNCTNTVLGETASSTQDLLYDLSAHYGSHTLRRAASYPLGPCYASRQRRRALKGHHDGRRQLWSLRAAHRLFCRRCGLFLRTGETKRLLSMCLPTVSGFPEMDEDAVSNTKINNTSNTTTTIITTTSIPMKKREDYVCCRCLRHEYESWRKNGSVDTSLFSFLANKKDTATTTTESVLCPAKVGRTCRRKRKNRENTVAPVKAVEFLSTAIVKTGNEMTTMKTTASEVPKGSLSRRKREREVAPKEMIPVEKGKKEAPQMEDNGGTQKRNSIAEASEKIIRMEKKTDNSNSSSLSSATATSKRNVFDKTKPLMGSEVPAVVENPLSTTPAIPKGRRPGAKNSEKSGNTSSNNSFANTMSRLGL
ncbi:hypothetical protein LSM04_008260 [Trypanosoma melophagium]|uniref:uncharacterized protein n=1 Tax=Trypanosoma melophagium TaxID=715481 RepID=UPI00351A5A53|nr:hypothetical protein LSM04_008260 [Trypanosoma melophagium]